MTKHQAKIELLKTRRAFLKLVRDEFNQHLFDLGFPENTKLIIWPDRLGFMRVKNGRVDRSSLVVADTFLGHICRFVYPHIQCDPFSDYSPMNFIFQIGSALNQNGCAFQRWYNFYAGKISAANIHFDVSKKAIESSDDPEEALEAFKEDIDNLSCWP